MNKKILLMLVVAMSVGAFTQTAVAQSAADGSVEAAVVPDDGHQDEPMPEE